jgi:hypothetical protein
VWPGYKNMGFTQNFVVKPPWKITTWKTRWEGNILEIFLGKTHSENQEEEK